MTYFMFAFIFYKTIKNWSTSRQTLLFDSVLCIFNSIVEKEKEKKREREDVGNKTILLLITVQLKAIKMFKIHF